MQWIVITGGGSGIGRALVHHFARDHYVLTCGRRLTALQETQAMAAVPAHVTIVQADIADAQQRTTFAAHLPLDASVRLLVQNAAIGDPAPELAKIDVNHFEKALQVNVVAPLALTQLFLPALQRRNEDKKNDNDSVGRILHLGTSVAHRPQKGTLTYGVTKMALHRLYQQINVEALYGGDTYNDDNNNNDRVVVCGSMSPGMVDTPGVREHVSKARKCDLAHVQYFDQALAKPEMTTPMDQLMTFVDEVLAMDATTFVSQEWRFNEWRARKRAEQDSKNRTK